MEGRWYIYREGRPEGPMTAAEIRDGLRDGSFDPFDLVAREGSNVRVELVEVDEIFVNSKVVYGDGAAEARALPPDAAAALGEELAGGAISAQGERTRPNNKSADVRMGKGHLALADESVGRTSGQPRSFHPSYAPGGGSGYHVEGDSGLQQQRSRREPKSYFVMDGRGRVLGPVSARDIQALFFKGVLDKSVVVMKNGSRSRVRIDKFVAVYSQQRGGRPGGAGGGEVASAAHPAVQGPLQVGRLTTNQIMKSAYLEREKLTLLAYLLSALLVGLAGLVLWRSEGEAWFAKAKSEVEDLGERLDEPAGESGSSLKPKKAPKLKPSKRHEGRKVRAARLEREAERRREVAKERKAERRAEKRKKEREKKRLAEQRREERLATQRAEERRRRGLAEQRKQELEKRRLEARRRIDAEWRNRERLEALRKQREAVKAKLAKKTDAPKAKPAPAPAPRPAKPSGPQVAALADGQQVTRLGPMSFNRAQVEGCEAACSVTFSGAGGTVTAKFFKTVWGPTLLSKSGSVYLTGLVRKSGGSTTIILSNIQ